MTDFQNPTAALPEGGDAPFTVELERLDETPDGYFTPRAHIRLTPALRTSRLWHALPGEETKTLLLMLTFLHPNGWCQPTLSQIAAAMETSEGKAHSRLERLAQIPWRGAPAVAEVRRENGLNAWAPAPSLFEVKEMRTPPAQPPGIDAASSDRRAAIVACSRARYAHPRDEVEREIAQRVGWEPPAATGDTSADADERKRLYQALALFGLSREEAQDLLERFSLTRIARQVEWLPFRHAKNAARFLRAAIEEDYEEPQAVRRQTLRNQNAPASPTPTDVAAQEDAERLANASQPESSDQPSAAVGDEDLPPLTIDPDDADLASGIDAIREA